MIAGSSRRGLICSAQADTTERKPKMDRLPRWGFRSRGLDDQWPPEQTPAPWWAVLTSKQGLASGLFRPGGMAFEPGRWGKGTPKTDK